MLQTQVDRTNNDEAVMGFLTVVAFLGVMALMVKLLLTMSQVAGRLHGQFGQVDLHRYLP